MAYRYGERHQMNLFPQSIEDYVSVDDPVRAYDGIVEALDFKELGIEWDEEQVGNPEYDPKAMIKLLTYGYSYGIRSSRKLERAVHHNISFIWLMGSLKPDHKTIARFRKNNKTALKNILKQCARMCIKLGLIEGNTLFVDGTKIRAAASINNTWSEEKCARYLNKIEEQIASILRESEAIDDKEQEQESMVKLKKELGDKEALKTKIQEIIKELKSEDKKSINSTDHECVKVKGRQGTHAGYNGQIVVDEKHGLIVNSDVVNESTDRKQFTNQINQANQTLDKPCNNACADAGYASTSGLKQIDEQGITVIVPSQNQANGKVPGKFDKEHFAYDKEKDCYVCPEGQEIPYSHFSVMNKQHVAYKSYRFKDASICFACRFYGACTDSKRGRTVTRLPDEETKLKLEKQYKTEQCQAIYKLRKQKVELPFGHMKRNLGVNTFLIKGLEGVRAEMSLLSTCFNVSRMITLLGVRSLLAQLAY